MRQPQPDQDLTRLAFRVEKQTAVLFPLAVHHLKLELSVADGYGTGGDGSGVRGTNASSSTERAAAMRYGLTTDLEEIMEERAELIAKETHLTERLRKILGERAPRHVPTLCDGRGLAGWELPWEKGSRDPNNGWSRPDCREVAGPSGLCDACRVRCARYRTEHDLKPLSEEQVTAA